MGQKDKDAAHEQMDTPEPWTRVVYVTPEMMSMGGYIKGIMRRLVERRRLARFVVDEAHCVSQVSFFFVVQCRADAAVGSRRESHAMLSRVIY